MIHLATCGDAAWNVALSDIEIKQWLCKGRKMCDKRLVRAAGFTLVEVLTVLSVMAVLASILFAVFSRVREKAHSATCQNNLRQIAMAMQQYVQDSNGRYPTISDPSGNTWANYILPYTKNVKVFECPTISKPLPPYVDPLGTLYLVYRYNGGRLHQLDPAAIVGKSEAAADLSSHTSTIFLNVCDPPPETEEENTWEEIQASCGRHVVVGHDVRHHSGGTNWSFLDGHVKWLTPEQLAELSCANPADQAGAVTHP